MQKLEYTLQVDADGNLMIPPRLLKEVGAIFKGREIAVTIERKKKRSTWEQHKYYRGCVLIHITDAINAGLMTGHSVNRAKALSMLPSNYLNVASFVHYVGSFSEKFDLKYRIYDAKELTGMGCGGIMAVDVLWCNIVVTEQS